MSYGSLAQVRNVFCPAKSENVPRPGERLTRDTLYSEAHDFAVYRTKSLTHDSLSPQPRFSASWKVESCVTAERMHFTLKYVQINIHIQPQNTLNS